MSVSVAEKLRVANRVELDKLEFWLSQHPDLETFAVSGSRGWVDPGPVRYILRRIPIGAVMYHGAARGLDTIASRFWRRLGGKALPFPVTREQWRTLGRRAGIVRNEIMINRMPDVVLVFIRDNSSGSSHAAAYARELGIPTFVFRAA